MNLSDIADGVISTINPLTSVALLHSTGYTTAADGSRIPIYAAPIVQLTQVQELTEPELRQLDGLNMQGVRGARVYFDGTAAGVIRVTGGGGDLVQFGGQTWLVAAVLEQWDDWCSVAVVLQNGS